MPAPSPDEREEKLRERLERIEVLEKEVKAREKALKKAETLDGGAVHLMYKVL